MRIELVCLPANLNDAAVALQEEVCSYYDVAEDPLLGLESINKKSCDVLRHVRELRKELDLLEAFADRQRRWSYMKMGRDHDDIPTSE